MQNRNKSRNGNKFENKYQTLLCLSRLGWHKCNHPRRKGMDIIMAIIQCNFSSPSLMRIVPIQVILPTDNQFAEEDYGYGRKLFKTLFLLHGVFGNCTDWVNATRIQQWAQERNLAVVMPSGENKFYVDQKVPGERYGSFIRKDLVAFARKTFPLSDKREDTFIGGLSMGGYGAIVNALQAPQTFSAVCALSSALVIEKAMKASEDTDFIISSKGFYELVFGDLDKLVGSDKDYYALAESLAHSGEPLPKIYMASGTEDELITVNHQFRDKLNSLGYDVTWEEGTGGHDWVFWDTYIEKALDWLPLKKITRMPPPRL